MKEYELPAFLKGIVEETAYVRWLRRKAAAHLKRDRKRFGREKCSGTQYRQMIHRAVQEGGEYDHYTGLRLDWKLISRYNNDDAKEQRLECLRRFADLPTVDHVVAPDGSLRFVICSWRVNDCKSHLSEEELWALCEQILAHKGRRALTPKA